MKFPWQILKKSEFETMLSNNILYQALFSRRIYAGAGDPMPDNPEAQMDEGYAGNVDWYSIIGRMAAMGTQAPAKLYDYSGTKKKEILNHPLLDLVENPNSAQTQQEFETAWWIYINTIGNAFIYTPLIEFGKDTGKTTEMYMMPSQYVEVVQSNDWMKPVAGYRLNWDEVFKFSPAEIYHSKLFDPRYNWNNRFYGMSPLVAAARTLRKNTEAEKIQQKQFENTSPPYMIQRKPENNALNAGFTTQQKEAYEKELQNYSKKYKGGAPFVSMMPVEVLRLGLSVADLNTIESSKDGLRKLCNALNMPSVIFNDNESSTYNNIESAMKYAWTHGIRPKKDMFIAMLNKQLIYPVKEYANLRFEADYSQVDELQDDMVSKVNWMRNARWTPNEIREATGKETIADDIMNQPIFAANEVPLSDFNISLNEGITDDYTEE